MTQTLSAARAGVDAVLTKIQAGYSPQGHIGTMLMPRVMVPQRAGTIIKHGKQAFMSYNTLRAPGAETARLELTRTTDTYALEDHSIEAKVPREIREEANSVGVDEASIAIETTREVIDLSLENSIATLATTQGNYSSGHYGTPGTLWDAATPGDPITYIANAIDVIRQKIGVKPNFIAMGAQVWLKGIAPNSYVKNAVYGSSNRQPMVTEQQFTQIFGLEGLRVAVGGAVNATDAGVFSDVWAKHMIIAYVNPNPDRRRQSFGYTYTENGYPMVEQPYWENQTKSWVYGYTDCRGAVAVNMDAGFLVEDPIS